MANEQTSDNIRHIRRTSGVNLARAVAVHDAMGVYLGMGERAISFVIVAAACWFLMTEHAKHAARMGNAGEAIPWSGSGLSTKWPWA